MTLLASLRNVLAFGAALAAGAAVLHPLVPFPVLDEVQPKLDYLAAHPGEFDTFFFGSSRVYHHVLPSIFDQLTAEAGVPTRSFNFGIDGMYQPETGYFLEHFLRLHSRGLRWVFVETTPVHAALEKDETGTIRGMYWHDLLRTKWEWRSALLHYPPARHPVWASRLARWSNIHADFWPHLIAFAERSLNFGGVVDAVQAKLGVEGKAPPKPPYDGYDVAKRPEQMEPAGQSQYEQQLAKRKTQPPIIDYADAVSQEAFRTLLEKIERETGAKVVLIGSATLNLRHFHPQPEGRWPVLDFWDVTKYPELYDVAVRQDTDHVNQAGARIFTRLLAERFCQEVAQRP